MSSQSTVTAFILRFTIRFLTFKMTHWFWAFLWLFALPIADRFSANRSALWNWLSAVISAYGRLADVYAFWTVSHLAMIDWTFDLTFRLVTGNSALRYRVLAFMLANSRLTDRFTYSRTRMCLTLPFALRMTLIIRNWLGIGKRKEKQRSCD